MTSSLHLRDYQREAVNAVFDQWSRVQSTMVVIPTGGGKTLVFAEIIKQSQPCRALVLSDRRELVWQARDKIQTFAGLNVEVEMAGERAVTDLFQECHAVSSSIQSQTPGRRGDPFDYEILICDEAHSHTAKNKSYTDVINHYKQNPALKILGVTATPTPQSRAMYDSIAYTYELQTAIEEGYLVPIEQQMVHVQGLDYSHIRTTAGDLNGAELAAVVENERVCQGMIQGTLEVMFGVPQQSLSSIEVTDWSKFLFANGTPKRNLIFTVSVAQAKMMSDILNRVHLGMASWVCGDVNQVSEDERARILKDFDRGNLLTVTNCGVLTKGYDNPSIEMITMARPTKSAVLFQQMTGRGTRTLTGTLDGLNSVEERQIAIAASPKSRLLVLDFSGNCGKHKLISTLDVIGTFEEPVRERAKKKAEKSGVPQDSTKLLLESEEELRNEKIAREREEAARKSRLIAKSTYALTSSNPFERYHVKYQGPSQWERSNGMSFSDKQKNVIKKMGIDPNSISVSCGRKLIGEYFKQPSPGQANVLIKFGYSTDCTSKEASAIIDSIAKNNWRRPA